MARFAVKTAVRYIVPETAMIIQSEEYDELERYFQQNLTGFGHEFFASRPHLLLPLNFDQYRSVQDGEIFPEPWHERGLASGPQSFYRKPTGQWCWLFGVFSSIRCLAFGVRGGPYSGERFMDVDRIQLGNQVVPACVLVANKFGDQVGVENVQMEELLTRVKAIVANPDHMDISTLWSGRLWTPEAQQEQRVMLANGTADILKALRSETATLADISWQQLEDIVVEILRSKNFEIHKATERPQGGRDVIARTWILGEPFTLAVEVKHREVVEPGHVRDAIYANQHFNGLLFVTSGRFSSGVIRERHQLGNQLRLILKDGVALRDWIRAYPFKSDKP